MSPPARCYATSSRGRRTRDRSRPRASLLATTTGAQLLTTTTRSQRDRATLGSRHRGVANLRDPPAGPHVPAARRVLPVVPDERSSRSHGGAGVGVPARGLRQQVPVPVAVATGSVGV